MKYFIKLDENSTYRTDNNKLQTDLKELCKQNDCRLFNDWDELFEFQKRILRALNLLHVKHSRCKPLKFYSATSEDSLRDGIGVYGVARYKVYQVMEYGSHVFTDKDLKKQGAFR